MVENLSHLPLRSDEVRRTRDVCVNAHRTILEAETERIRPIQVPLARSADVPANERRVLKHLDADTPRQIDDLACATQLDHGALADALLELEIKGFVAALPGGFYVRRL